MPHRGRGIVKRAREIPLGLWSAEQQFQVRNLVADMLHEYLKLREEVIALRTRELDRPPGG